jgi:GNAT superfamily N-acetyltransferase
MNTSAVGKIKMRFYELGLGRTAVWVMNKAVTSALTAVCRQQTCFIIQRSLDGRLPEMHAKIPLSVRFASIDDLSCFQGIREPWSRYQRIFRERFRRGQTCIISFHQEKAVGYLWMTDIPESDKRLGLTITPDAEESYGFDLYVLPEYRRELVGFDLVSRWLTHARSSGKRRAIGVVASQNQPMLIMTKLAFGFRRAREVRSLEFFRSFGVIIDEKELS